MIDIPPFLVVSNYFFSSFIILLNSENYKQLFARRKIKFLENDIKLNK